MGKNGILNDKVQLDWGQRGKVSARAMHIGLLKSQYPQVCLIRLGGGPWNLESLCLTPECVYPHLRGMGTRANETHRSTPLK